MRNSSRKPCKLVPLSGCRWCKCWHLSLAGTWYGIAHPCSAVDSLDSSNLTVTLHSLLPKWSVGLKWGRRLPNCTSLFTECASEIWDGGLPFSQTLLCYTVQELVTYTEIMQKKKEAKTKPIKLPSWIMQTLSTAAHLNKFVNTASPGTASAVASCSLQALHEQPNTIRSLGTVLWVVPMSQPNVLLHATRKVAFTEGDNQQW